MNLELACVRRSVAAFTAADPQYRHGALGHGAADQFQYYLYDRHDPQNIGDTGPWRFGISDRFCDCHVCFSQAFFLKKIDTCTSLCYNREEYQNAICYDNEKERGGICKWITKILF